MRKHILIIFEVAVFVSSLHGRVSTLSELPCGDWLPYKNEECVKLVDRAGMQSKVDAEVVCNAFREELHGPDLPKLVTIKTKEKQEFLQKLLFEDLHTVDNVWLGLNLGNDGNFSWNDGTKLFFTNFADEVVESRADNEHNCLQMESGDGVYKTGRWIRASCKKRNAVVCERIQPLTLAALQNVVLNLKLEMERNKQEHEQKLIEVKNEADEKYMNAKKEADQKIKDLRNEADQKNNVANQKIAEASQQIATLKNNPVPVGFIYVQLPGQEPPTTLWPQTAWKDVGSEYAGLFFRAEGGDAAPFGDIQEDNTRRLAKVWHVVTTSWGSPVVPEDGTWSTDAFTGNANAGGTVYGLRFRLTTGEVRPKNKSVKIWRRVN